MRDLDAIGFLIQLDRLFPGGAFSPAESEALLARLRSLPAMAVTIYKDSLGGGTYSGQAAVILIQDDTLFEQGRFQQSAFDVLLRERRPAAP